MKLSFTTVDVFTKTRFSGNPLAIVHVPSEHHTTLTQEQKQTIAREFNLSETVFLHQVSSDPVIVDIFLPTAEIPFAGHPTIGSAWYVLEHEKLPVQALRVKAGTIPIALVSGLVRASLPHNVHIHAQTMHCPLNQAENPIVSIVNGVSFILVRLPDLETLAQANGPLHKDVYNPTILDEGWRQGPLGTLYYVARGMDGSGNAAFRTRMHLNFEDPATGSASGALGAYLALHEPTEKGMGPFKYALTQGVEMGKTSEISVETELDGERGVKSVYLAGTAVKVMEGTLEI